MTIQPDRRAMMRLPLGAALTIAAPAAAQTSPSRNAPMTDDGAHAFDFLHGAWSVRHRRLKERLAGNDEWVEFDGTCACRPLMQGAGNVEDNWLDLPAGAYHAVGLRSFDPPSRSWAIWWLDSRNPHTLDVPVVGSFSNGVGTFLADDTFGGHPIKVRFTWSDITPHSARWAQAFSPDGGATWETNWVMQFTRRG